MKTIRNLIIAAATAISLAIATPASACHFGGCGYYDDGDGAAIGGMFAGMALGAIGGSTHC